jgi:hypothetical protein
VIFRDSLKLSPEIGFVGLATGVQAISGDIFSARSVRGANDHRSTARCRRPIGSDPEMQLRTSIRRGRHASAMSVGRAERLSLWNAESVFGSADTG